MKSEKDFEEYLSNKKTYSIKEIKEKLKVEILWNDLIYKIYNNKVKIDESKLIKRINNEKNFTNEYLLSEIFFKIEKGEKKNTKFKKIKSSIDNVGFSNTANLFSTSKSSSYGGKIGWVQESNLSTKIKGELKKIDIGQYSKIIQVGNNFLILKIEDKRSKSKIINKEARLEELKKFETNRQLNLFSNIHFNKIKINYVSNEI